jgi:HK97 family phage prohead protease
MEIRQFDVVVRSEGEKLVGLAVPFDKPSNPITEKGRTFTEIIAKGALDITGNVSFLHRHQPEAVYGDVASGNLSVWESQDGIEFSLMTHPFQGVIREQVKAGRLRMSVGMLVNEYESRGNVQIVKRGVLDHISTTPMPAYPQTSVSVREDDRRKMMWRKIKVRG